MASPIAVLVDKAEGVSSFGALAELKRQYGTRRVGHTGTLDPMATGLLIALIGTATRCARFFSGLDKTYVAEITFGRETDTDDRTGTSVREAAPPPLGRVLEQLSRYEGSFEQVPPAYSAVHVQGERAYRLARSGQTPDLDTRKVTIHSIHGMQTHEHAISLTICCTAGTYIRSFARDLGRDWESAAHLSGLRRTAVGPFEVSETGERRAQPLPIQEALARLEGFRTWEVNEATARLLRNGSRIPPGRTEPAADLVVAVFGGEPVAVGKSTAHGFDYEIVFPAEPPI